MWDWGVDDNDEGGSRSPTNQMENGHTKAGWMKMSGAGGGGRGTISKKLIINNAGISSRVKIILCAGKWPIFNEK